jgi:hypothetical protein
MTNGRNPSNYDLCPFVSVPGAAGTCVEGWAAVAGQIERAVAARGAPKSTVIIECYPGVDEETILRELSKRLRPEAALRMSDALLPPERIEAMVAPFLGEGDPVFGFLSGLTLPQFFEAARIEAMRQAVGTAGRGLVLVVGCGARLVDAGDILVYADLSRREAQLRFRRGETGNLGAAHRPVRESLKYKRAYFVDWRVADRWKRPLIARWDFLLDTHEAERPKLAQGDAVRRGLEQAVTRPFRVVPYFDPAPWGGQWMREALGLGGAAPNYGWGFDCVPEENSLLLELGGIRVEIPSLDLVFHRPRELLGDRVHARFGDEFPIRFDFLDTMKGGNLSFQVHPLTEYIQGAFGMHYTQDESYYLLEAGDGGAVYLGLKEGVDRAAMARDLREAQRGNGAFDADRYANRFPARKHDHFLIPAGTVHCSGANCVILEISATPYIFTFKLWDWGRLGLDGRPRPIHLDHGLANIQWDRTSELVRRELVNRVEAVGSGEGWREERTGLHEREFIEVRRHWFHGPVPHRQGGGVNVLNLVQGREAVVESPTGAFEPFPVHYAETFIVPAAVGDYVLRPLDPSMEHATVKAFVR